MGLGVVPAVLLLAVLAPSVWAAEPAPPKNGHSCRLLLDEQRKCTMGECDKQLIARLRRECLRDGGRT
jgi:hypothetical protein